MKKSRMFAGALLFVAIMSSSLFSYTPVHAGPGLKVGGRIIFLFPIPCFQGAWFFNVGGLSNPDHTGGYIMGPGTWFKQGSYMPGDKMLGSYIPGMQCLYACGPWVCVLPTKGFMTEMGTSLVPSP